MGPQEFDHAAGSAGRALSARLAERTKPTVGTDMIRTHTPAAAIAA